MLRLCRLPCCGNLAAVTHRCAQVRVVQRDLLELEELCKASGVPLTPA